MSKIFFIISAISGIVSVSLGAFGAHALKDKLEAGGFTQTYQTAVQYQFYHTLALLLIAIMCTRFENAWLNWSGYSFIVGILIFSGSLYLMCFTGMRWLGAITPIGGLAFIIGWGFLLLAALQIKF